MIIKVFGKGFVSDHLDYEKIYDVVRQGDEKRLESIIDYEKPDVLINCIGRTGRPNIDWCETHQYETYHANVTIPLMLTEVCRKQSIHLIQMSSGCVFYGDAPRSSGWLETDATNPLSYYSKTKYCADMLLSGYSNVTSLRLRMPISDRNNPRNLINKIRNYDKLIDIPNSMTLMEDLVRCVDWAAKNSKTGIYHVTNPEPMSAAQIMTEFQKYQPDHKFRVISEEELDQITEAKRSNCILDSSKLKTAGFEMTPSKEGLENCMRRYVANLGETR